MVQRPLEAQLLRRPAASATIGRLVETHDEISSTNSVALTRAIDPANHGLAVFAEYQTAGRGRLGRSWDSPRGASVLCSVLLFMEPTSTRAATVLLWSALAVRDAILEACSVDTTIKWPNDLLAGGGKVSGILIETTPAKLHRAFVIGIGINCLQHDGHFPPDQRRSAISLDQLSSHPVDRLLLAQSLLGALDRRFEAAAGTVIDELAAEWSGHAMPIGRRLRLFCEGRHHSGSLIALHPAEGILVELDCGGRRLFSPFTTTIEHEPAG